MLKNIFSLNGFIFTFGIIPATLWFFSVIFIGVIVWDTMYNLLGYSILTLAALIGTLGLWFTVFMPLESYLKKTIVIFMLIIGILTIVGIYFSAPWVFKEIEMTIFLPAISGLLAIFKILRQNAI